MSRKQINAVLDVKEMFGGGGNFDPTKAKALLKTVKSKMAGSEHRTVILKGVKNLSRSDLESLEMYCDNIIKTGSIGNMMAPRGNIEAVLKKFAVMENTKTKDLDDINEARESQQNIDYLIQDLQNAKKQGVKMVKCKGTLWVEDPAKSYSDILMTSERQM